MNLERDVSCNSGREGCWKMSDEEGGLLVHRLPAVVVWEQLIREESDRGAYQGAFKVLIFNAPFVKYANMASIASSLINVFSVNASDLL